ncbi:uncharacterized protein SPPG_03018 [Spizellomyces punctatus DAOM BR117]|uniref:Trichohyalin-plectin-homology domain-containing protein n=1 Tax=Spizellomyces punctatus (strain DAOM BR117) TaxID=645134 RepID=A0A0L0HNQ6_SPIPD|nr:uncharacterized protein SPPG_03018 [Spizellomyces punctatus DAOM BR117]KND02560.1 hypothetical protein SPPG_03018 [Spizellomyces punctatus DAOM BR117]|eukprot:XP_016610599.1 hypothetical protein SPPG_03018 [Spizellomyces punctatus DAOM BR117]
MPGVAVGSRRGNPSVAPVLNAVDFVPYNATHDHKSSYGNTSPGHLVASDELDRAKRLALETQAEENLRNMMEKEKVELHRKSLDRVQNWGNTVLGQRRQRLAAKEERMAKLEEERQKVDQEWAKLKDAKRQEAIDRARWMQRTEQPRIKQLHSSLLLSNVLEERNRQLIENEQRRKTLEKAKHAEEARLRHAEEEALRKEQEAMVRARIAAYQTAEDQLQQVAAKRHGKSRSRASSNVPGTDETRDDEKWAAESRRAAAQERELRLTDRQRQLKLEEEQRKALDAAKEQHEAEKRKILEDEKLLKEEAEKFAEMKRLFAVQRKEAEKRIIQERQNKSEAASRIAAEQSLEYQRRREEFLEKNIHAHDGLWEKRMAEEQARHKKALEQEASYQIEHLKEMQERRRRELEEGLAIRQKFEREATEFIEGGKAEKATAHKNLDILKKAHKEQMEMNERRRKQERSELLEDELAARREQETEDEAFENYAMQLMKEWRAAGKDVTPILRVLRQDNAQRKPERPVPPGQQLVNTFSRLGFPGRSTT